MFRVCFKEKNLIKQPLVCPFYSQRAAQRQASATPLQQHDSSCDEQQKNSKEAVNHQILSLLEHAEEAQLYSVYQRLPMKESRDKITQNSIEINTAAARTNSYF